MGTEKYGWDSVTRIKARVIIRPLNPHNGGEVKPNCWAINGRVFEFTYGWRMGEDDPYPNEIAWTPPLRYYNDGDWPNTAPSWIASGDLEIIEEY
tara:strand:+ start:425 stop:709 length:285 start_codon:yes stop_codon:yes gene_type:complete